MVEEMEEKLVKAEDDMETEKEKLVQEVSRGKSAAITLLQVRYSPFIPLLHRLLLDHNISFFFLKSSKIFKKNLS